MILFLTGSDFKNLVLIILVDAWTVIPSVMIILLAGLQNLPESAKEAGYLFGGNGWTVMRKITLPLIAANLIAGALLAFSFAMLEVSDSLILASQQRDFPITKG